jgi:spermidine synthase
VFLVGLGIGTGIGSLLSRLSSPRAWLGVCQLLAALAIAWTAYTLAYSLPYWPIEPARSTRLWFTFQVDLMRCIWAVLPPACIWGASFPLALAAVASKGQDSGRLVGEVYAANTVGAIAGAVGFSVLFIPWIGTQNSQRLLIALSAVAAFTVLMRLRRPSLVGALSVAVAVCLVTVLVRGVGEIPWTAIAYGRRMLTTLYPGQLLYRGEGMNSSIVISQLDAGQIYFHVSGKVEASTEPFDMRLQRMLAHVPALVHSHPRSILVVGFGAGVTAGTFLVHPEIEKIVICEIEKLIPPAASRYFAEENHNVLHDRRTKIVYDDGRHYILTTPDKFDIITADPIHPWVKGTAALYSKEYFELVKRHLNPGGVIAQWVPLYESDPDTVKSELATFFEVFPGGTIWSNDNNGEGYDVVLLGQREPTKIDVDQLQQRLDRDDQKPVVRSLSGVGLASAVDLLATYGGRAPDLRPWLEHAHVNRDLDLRLQYLAGMGLNFNNAPVIGSQIRTYRRFPNDLFAGSPQRIQALKNALRL